MNCRAGGKGARICLGAVVGLALWGWLSLGGLAAGLEVNGDAEFLRVPGVMGAGTEEDPFVITGVFDAQGGPFALRIRNTRAHFLIEGAVFRGASEAGLWLENVENGWVVACVFEGNEVGVKVSGDRVGVTFTLNTFWANRRHAAGRAQGVRWDDGRVGNFWEGYAGTDGDGDGIGDVPHRVIPVKNGWDDFPLVAPLFGIEPPEGAVLLQFRANVGDRIITEVEMTVSLAAKFLEEELRQEMGGRIVAEGVVVGRYGGGSSYDLRLTVLEEEWTETPSEGVEPASVPERVRIHRFGAWEEREQAPYPFHHKGWPARWLRVGDTWMHEGEFGADAIGLPGGTARYREVYKLEKIEERNGRPAAVVAVTGEMEIQSLLEEDPLLGRLEMHLKGTVSGTHVVDLHSGCTHEISGVLIFSGESTAFGMAIGKVEMRIHFQGKEFLVEVPAKPAVVEEEDRLQRLEAQLRELAAEVAALRETVQAQAQRLVELAQARPLRIGVVDAEAVFSRVFLELVKEERAAMEAKSEEIRSLEAEYAAGKIQPDTYQKRYLALQTELLQARLHILLAILDLMITASAFAPMEEELILLQAEVQRLGSWLEEALALTPAELPNLIQQLDAAIQRLDHLLTQITAAKILEIVQEVAREMEMDIVLRTKDAVLFYREAVVVDLSPAVEARLRALFREGH